MLFRSPQNPKTPRAGIKFKLNRKMFAKFTVACAIVVVAVQGKSTDYSYSKSAYHKEEKSYDFPWDRRSTFRPLDVKGTEIVDKYWKKAPVEQETIKATCEFEFTGKEYGYSTGRL